MTAIGAKYTGEFGTLDVKVDMVGPESQPVPGRTSYWLNDEQISQDEAQQIIDEWWRRRTPTADSSHG